MNIDIVSQADLTRVTLEGEMTIYAAAELKDSLFPAVEACKEMEISLAGVSEIDGSGLQLLALIKREAAAKSKKLEFVAHSPAILDMIDLCNLAGIFGDPLVLSSPQS